MNDHDRSNLNFLLNADKDILREWYDAVSEDDREYAQELLIAYKEELAIKQRFYDAEEVNLDGFTSDANEYLKRFRLSK